MKKLLLIILTLLPAVCRAEITGAVGCNAGELAIINCDKEAVWSVYPAEYSTSFAVSDDGRTLYFASPKHGKVTFFAASVVDGLPYLEQHSLYNGLEIPDVKPEPTPTPEPAPIVETLESVITANAKGKPAAELTALADSFAFVVDGLERGTIKTTVGARETFRAIYAEKGTAAGEKTLDDLSQLVDAVSGKIDNSTLIALRDDYETAAKTIRSFILAKQPEKKPEPKQEEAKDCPNGNCPTGHCPNGQCPNATTQRRFFWWY